MNVETVMHAGIETVAADTKICEIARLMRDKDIGCVAVGDTNGVAGIVTDRDIVVRSCADQACGDRMAADIMSAPVVHCSPHQDVWDAARLMESRQVRRLPVIDMDGQVVGILSLGDLAHCGYRDLAAEAISAVSAHHPDQLVLGEG